MLRPCHLQALSGGWPGPACTQIEILVATASPSWCEQETTSQHHNAPECGRQRASSQQVLHAPRSVRCSAYTLRALNWGFGFGAHVLFTVSGTTFLHSWTLVGMAPPAPPPVCHPVWSWSSAHLGGWQVSQAASHQASRFAGLHAAFCAWQLLPLLPAVASPWFLKPVQHTHTASDHQRRN